MKNKAIKIITLLGSLSLAMSCAEDYPNPTEGAARESFDRWIKNNAPQAVPIGDIYIDYIDTSARSTLDSIVIPTIRKSYVKINYTGRTLDGSIFVTRSEATAKLVGSWSVKTHYCDDYLILLNGSTTICQGLYQGITNMRQGDSVRIYIPSNLGYVADFGFVKNYLTSGVSYQNYPVMMDLRLQNVVEHPEAFELKNLQQIAFSQWKQESRDTVYPGIYMRKLNYNYDGYKITADSSVYVNYAEYFVDSDFLIRSNIDSVIRANPEYTAKDETNKVPIQMQVGTTSYGEIFRQGLRRMRQGETAEFLVMAKNTKDGEQGNPSYTPEILPYQSRRFVIQALTKKQYDEINKK